MVSLYEIDDMNAPGCGADAKDTNLVQIMCTRAVRLTRVPINCPTLLLVFPVEM